MGVTFGFFGIMENEVETTIYGQCARALVCGDRIVAVWDAVGATVPYQYTLVEALPSIA